jgi:hypothetical protein
MMIEAIRSSGTSVLKRATRRNILEDGILCSHRRENHRSYLSIIIYYSKSYIKFVHHRKHITTPLQSPSASCCLLRGSYGTQRYTVWAAVNKTLQLFM